MECDFSNEKILQQTLQEFQKTVIIHDGLLVAAIHCTRKVIEFVASEKQDSLDHYLKYRGEIIDDTKYISSPNH